MARLYQPLALSAGWGEYVGRAVQPPRPEEGLRARRHPWPESSSRSGNGAIPPGPAPLERYIAKIPASVRLRTQIKT